MQRFCALIVWLMVGFAIIAGPGIGIGPAMSEKQNKDQDKKNKKKTDAMTQLPGYFSRPGIHDFCNSVSGTYSHFNEHDGKGHTPVAMWKCDWGCGEVGCHDSVKCSAIGDSGKARNTGKCRHFGGGKSPVGDIDPIVSDTDSSILDSGPPLSVNQPSRTGTPKAPPSIPLPPSPPPPPNPG